MQKNTAKKVSSKSESNVTSKTNAVYRGFSKEQLIDVLYQMQLIRDFEEKTGFAYRLRKIGGFCHLCSGQEAVSLGTIKVLDLKKDYVLTSYRDHGHAIACGLSPDNIMAELYGKITGCSRGKGGSMHLFDVKNNFYGGNGIVGAQIPIGTGLAFASKYRGENGVSLCFFGDGAINQGAFHESINLAQLWNIPCIYIVENNFYGMGTSVNRASSIDFSKVGEHYGVDGIKVDGMDFFSVYEKTKQVVEQTREKSKPFVIEFETYRYYGHSMSDPANYRTKTEVENFKSRDPIETMKTELIEANFLTDEEFKDIVQRVEKEVQKAEKFAEDSPEPPLETLYEDILKGE